jgi:hypothetical protein
MPDLDVQPPLFHGLAGNTYSAARLRRYLQTLLGDAEGVHSYSDLRVTPNSPAAMNVLVAPGRGLVNGDAVARQGAYLLEQASQMTVPIAANASGNPRIDLVVLRDYDGAADGGSASADKGTIEVVQGTPAGSPTVPSLPAGAIPLAQVAVANGASSIVTANITDLRIPLGRATPVSAFIDTTTVAGLTSGATIALGNVRVDTFGLTTTANRINLLPQEPRAGLWRFSARVTMNQAMANNWALAVLSSGVDKIIGSSAQRGPSTESQPTLAVSGFALTTAAAATRYLQLAVTHTESGPSLASAALEATYLGPAT